MNNKEQEISYNKFVELTKLLNEHIIKLKKEKNNNEIMFYFSPDVIYIEDVRVYFKTKTFLVK